MISMLFLAGVLLCSCRKEEENNAVEDKVESP